MTASRRGFLPRAWPLLLLLAGAALYITIQVVSANAQRHDNDFKHIYLGTAAILEGDSPYPPEWLFLHARRRAMTEGLALNPYVYLPFTGLSLAFLEPLPFPAASQLWFMLNHLFALASAWLIAITLWPRHRTAAFGGVLLALALSHPLTRTLTAGQLNLVLLICAAGAYAGLSRGRQILGGILLGYAAVFKLAPAIYGLYFLLRCRWRSLAAMAATVVVLLGVSVAVAGWQMHAGFLPMLADMRYGRSTWQHIRPDGGGATFWKDPPNQSPNSLLTHLLVENNGITEPWFDLNQGAANAATWVVTAALFSLYGWAAWRSRKLPEIPGKSLCTRSESTFSLGDQGLFHATLLLSLLLPSLMWDHYLVAAILPAAWLARRYASHRRWGMLGLLAGVWIVISVPWNYAAPAWREGAGVILMSVKLFPTLVLFGQVCRETAVVTKA